MTPVRYHSGAFPPDLRQSFTALLPLVTEAHHALGKYDGMLEAVLNPNVLLSPLMDREAEQSSRIEGTQATLREVLEFEAGDDSAPAQRESDIREILNYRVAMIEAIHNLDTLPLSQRLIRNTHATLMRGVRGQRADPGNFRTIQNFIGPQGCSEQDARYLPCSANELPANLDAWEKFMNSTQPDSLIQLALVHAEFEAIHPFLDGNGRIGRLMIPLFLYEKQLIRRPSFFISEHLESRRDEYYDRLQHISESGDWQGWCEFFLRSVTAQANSNMERARAILQLHEKWRSQIVDITHSQYAIRALDYFFTRPIFNSAAFCRDVEIADYTARSILRDLRGAGILDVRREGRGRRSGIYAFTELLDIIS